MTRMKRGKKPFSWKKFPHPKEKEHHKNFDKTKVKCFNWNKKGHYARECREKKREKLKGIFHASTTTEGEPPRNNSSNDQETRNAEDDDHWKKYFLKCTNDYLISRWGDCHW